MNLSSSEDECSSSCSSSSSSINSDIVRAQNIENSNLILHPQNIDDSNVGKYDDDDDEFDDVDWEDAEIDEVECDNNGAQQRDDSRPKESKNAFENDGATSRIFVPRKAITNELDNPISPSLAPSLAPSQSPSSQRRTTKNKKRKRQFRKIQNISPQVQGLILAMYRAHMLSWTSRIIHLSSRLRFAIPSSNCRCSPNTNYDIDIWCVAHSLIPLDIIDESHQLSLRTREKDQEQRQQKKRQYRHHDAKKVLQRQDDTDEIVVVVPPVKLLKRFCLWFFDFINHYSERRRRIYESNIAAGAPTSLARTRTGTRQRSSKRIRQINKQRGSRGAKVGIKIQGAIVDNCVVHYKTQRLLFILKYISPTNDQHPNNDLERCIVSSIEKNLIFVCMTRSMGWRVRYVQAIDPMESDLTVNHPLFSLGVKNVLRCIVEGAPPIPTKSIKSKKRKRERTNAAATTAPLQNDLKPDLVQAATDCEEFQFENDISWVEVQCSKDDAKVSSQTTTTENNNRRIGNKSYWIHVDPHHELFDKPLAAESIRRRRTKEIKSTTPTGNGRSQKPFSYLLAVEHFSDSMIDTTLPISVEGENETLPCIKSSSAFATMRMTDVTPRYSNKWSLALRLRGATAKDVSSLGGRCPNVWWAETIKKANRYFGKRGQALKSRRGPKKLRKESRRTSGSASNAASTFVVEKSKNGQDVLVIDDFSDEQTPPPPPPPPLKLDEDNASYHEDSDSTDEDELIASIENESIPTSKSAFKNHPLFVIPSALKHQEVLSPASKTRICGMFKGEMVYKRADVSKALVAKKWLYEGHRVRDEELIKPAKIVKARKKPIQRGFQAIASYGATTSDQADTINASNIGREEDDGNNRLYGVWQTDKWSPPPIEPNDAIPVNEFNNVELALLNPGLTHLRLHRIAPIAKKLGIPYAPCLLGFEGHGGNLTPTIRGIVVHHHNADLLREAHTEWESEAVEIGYRKRQELIHFRWRRIVMGIMTKDRLEREYAKD